MKIESYEKAIKVLQDLKNDALDVRNYEDDIYECYRQHAEFCTNEIIDTLANLEISDDLTKE